MSLAKALTTRRTFATSLARLQLKGIQDTEAEKKLAKEKLQADPSLVSTASSTRPITGEVGAPEHEEDVDMMKTIRSDVQVIKDTFALDAVPKEAFNMGLAGVLPYVATSLSTVYLAYDINHAAEHGFGFIFDPKTAEALLHIIEPIQIGYGATIISFLGAIHWGLEWAGFGGKKGYPRYAIGVVATAAAWPTLLLSAEMGLISQFLTFVLLYFVDARAATIGWAPSWYSTYRFVLTFAVGAAIVLSLVGRGQIADKVTRAPGPADRMRALRESQVNALEEEEEERRARIVSEDETEDEEEADEGEGESDSKDEE